MKFCHIYIQNTPKLKWKFKKIQTYSSFHNYSRPLLLDVTALNTNKGTTPKSVLSISQTTPKFVFKVHGNVLTHFNVGSSAYRQVIRKLPDQDLQTNMT